MAFDWQIAANRFGIRLHSILAWRSGKTPVGHIRRLTVPGAAGPLPAKLYTPEGTGPFPLVVFYHGGGFCIGSLETHDALCRDLCAAAHAVVLSVAYRLAPEHPYPAAPEDAFAALEWASANAVELGARPGPVFVAGDSAGGCLATVVARRARDAGGPALAGQILIFPKVDMVGPVTESHRQNVGTSIISEKFIAMFEGAYMPDRRRAGEPDASPMQADSLAGLPPALVQTAELDPLRDESEAYAHRMQIEGVDVQLTRYDGVDHAFVGFTGPSEPHKSAIAEIAAWIAQHQS